LRPNGVLCEIMKDAGTMARMPDLERFAAEHGLHILPVADLIQYRLQTERLVKRLGERSLQLDATDSEWQAYVYELLVEPRQALALVKGTLDPDKPVLCRVHSGSRVADLFLGKHSPGGIGVDEALACIEDEGVGVFLYLDSQRSLAHEFDRLAPSGDAVTGGDAATSGAAPPPRDSQPDAASAGTSQHILRRFGLGAQVLADLGARQLRLLTNSRRRIVGLTGYGLEVVETVPLGRDLDA
jgi:3,4-dihydroxy 2-butanone 4-phosphate synthase/GTP cyclohydrolase II